MKDILQIHGFCLGKLLFYMSSDSPEAVHPWLSFLYTTCVYCECVLERPTSNRLLKLTQCPDVV